MNIFCTNIFHLIKIKLNNKMQFLWVLFFILLVIVAAMIITGKLNLFDMSTLGIYHKQLDEAAHAAKAQPNVQGGSHLGGYSDEMNEYISHGGSEGSGIVFESGTKEEKKEIKDLKAEGVAIAKNVIITGNVDVKGTLELRNSEVKGKMNVVGSLVSVGSDFGDLTLNGHGDVFRSKAGKISLCGKLKSKKSEIKQIDFSKSCKVGDMRAPFINLSETPVGKIVLPEGYKESDIVKNK